MASESVLRALLQFRRDGVSGVGADRVSLLEGILAHGSITAAAKDAGLSYKGAWDAVQALNNLFDRPLVVTRAGGPAGGAAEVTAAGRTLISAFRRMEVDLARVLADLGQRVAEDDLPDAPFWSLGMSSSVQNTFGGVVTAVTDGAVNSEVGLRIADGVDIVAIITKESVRNLGLQVGRRAAALIPASMIILAPADPPVLTSARNRLTGPVVHHEEGAVNDEVTLEIGPGKTLSATITKPSAAVLGVKLGVKLDALIKASHVILMVDQG